MGLSRLYADFMATHISTLTNLSFSYPIFTKLMLSSQKRCVDFISGNQKIRRNRIYEIQKSFIKKKPYSK